MRWDRFFEDLEDQVDSEWEAERAALDTEAERLRLARVTLRERLVGVVGSPAAVTVDLRGDTVLTGQVSAVGADWLAIDTATRVSGVAVVPLSALHTIGMPHPEILRSARVGTPPSRLSERMTFGFVLRDLVRRRLPVSVHTISGRALAGTIDRAGADHLDLALHEAGTPRRGDQVTGIRLVPFDVVAWVRIDSAAPLL